MRLPLWKFLLMGPSGSLLRMGMPKPAMTFCVDWLMISSTATSIVLLSMLVKWIGTELKLSSRLIV